LLCHRLKRSLFRGVDKNASISYRSMSELVKMLLFDTGVVTSKVCHAMRQGSARLLELMG
jgi:hypothetical protein